MRMDYPQMSKLARAALIVAASRRTVLTYTELGRAVGLAKGIPASHHLNRVLVLVSDECISAGEPSLAVLVVNQASGVPGPGFVPGPKSWSAEALDCYAWWAP